MISYFSELRYKEVIDVHTGTRMGYVCDAELEPDYYYAMLYQQENMLYSERSREAKEYYEQSFNAFLFAQEVFNYIVFYSPEDFYFTSLFFM